MLLAELNAAALPLNTVINARVVPTVYPVAKVADVSQIRALLGSPSKVA